MNISIEKRERIRRLRVTPENTTTDVAVAPPGEMKKTMSWALDWRINRTLDAFFFFYSDWYNARNVLKLVQFFEEFSDSDLHVKISLSCLDFKCFIGLKILIYSNSYLNKISFWLIIVILTQTTISFCLPSFILERSINFCVFFL